MEDLSEKTIRKNCPHCNRQSHAFRYLLEETPDFYIIADPYPIVEGHIIIFPKIHISCVGEFSDELFQKFLLIDQKSRNFVKTNYQQVSSFEHGVLGQTVFHAHIHYLPFNGKPTEIIPEGNNKFFPLNSLNDLKVLFKKNKGYLFFFIENQSWSVNPSLSYPAFFKDRFAKALNRPERGNWKKMHIDESLSHQAEQDAFSTQEKWKKFFKN